MFSMHKRIRFTKFDFFVGDYIDMMQFLNSVYDFYFYKSSLTPWKRWWTTNGTSQYTSSTVNGGTSTARDSLIIFDYAYNLKYSYIYIIRKYFLSNLDKLWLKLFIIWVYYF